MTFSTTKWRTSTTKPPLKGFKWHREVETKVLEQRQMGVGDTIVFLLHWNSRGQPQCSLESLRLHSKAGMLSWTSLQDVSKNSRPDLPQQIFRSWFSGSLFQTIFPQTNRTTLPSLVVTISIQWQVQGSYALKGTVKITDPELLGCFGCQVSPVGQMLFHLFLQLMFNFGHSFKMMVKVPSNMFGPFSNIWTPSRQLKMVPKERLRFCGLSRGRTDQLSFRWELVVHWMNTKTHAIHFMNQ